MKKTVTLEQDDINHLHDVILEALDFHEPIPNDVVIGVYHMLPEDLREQAEHWGLSDTVVRDNIYEWLQENKENLNNG